MASIWTQELSNDLASMVAEGSFYGIIAAALSKKYDIKITRGSVIGRAHRMGLVVPVRVTPPKKPRKKNNAARKPMLRIVANGGGGFRLQDSVTGEIPIFCHEVDSRNLTLEQLEPNDCRYINGDPLIDGRYCGLPIHKRSLCAGCYSRCYTAPLPPKQYAFRREAA